MLSSLIELNTDSTLRITSNIKNWKIYPNNWQECTNVWIYWCTHLPYFIIMRFCHHLRRYDANSKICYLLWWLLWSNLIFHSCAWHITDTIPDIVTNHGITQPQDHRLKYIYTICLYIHLENGTKMSITIFDDSYAAAGTFSPVRFSDIAFMNICHFRRISSKIVDVVAIL